MDSPPEERMSDDSSSIDIAAVVSTLARNWWVIVGLVVLGAVVGGLVTMAQPKEYTATSSVYIGQTTDANGNAMAGLNSNAKAATQLLSSQVVLNEAAKQAGDGMTSGKLRRETTVETPSSTVKTSTSVVNIVVISVTDTNKVRAAASANALADALLARLGGGVTEKTAVLAAQLAAGKKQEAAAAARSVMAQRALAAIARSGGSAGEKAAASASYLVIVQAAATEQSDLSTQNQKTALLLLSAQQVEKPRLLHEAAVPDSPSGPSMTLNVAAGVLAGLVIGIIVAFARRRLADRRAAAATTATA